MRVQTVTIALLGATTILTVRIVVMAHVEHVPLQGLLAVRPVCLMLFWQAETLVLALMVTPGPCQTVPLMIQSHFPVSSTNYQM